MLNVDWLAEQTKNKNVLLGVSGGADSMALLHMIALDRDKFTCNFKVLHVNHQINPESATWAKLVSNYCVDINMHCEIVNVDVGTRGNQEQAARRARYAAFADQKCDIIVLAHHADDQVETFFLKAFRGSGPKGLRCMVPVSKCWFDENKMVIRPLLSFTKSQLESYVSDHNVPFVTDPSNNNTTFDRNWIRHELMPFLKARNEIVDINIRTVAAIQNETHELLNDLAKIDFQNAYISDTELDWKKVKDLGTRRIKNLIMFICSEHNVVDLSIGHIEQFAAGLVDSTSDSRNELRLKMFKINKVGSRIMYQPV